MLDILEKQVEELEVLACNIEKDAVRLFQEVQISSKNIYRKNTGTVHHREYHWEHPSGELKKVQDKLIMEYQRWYSSSQYLVNEYLPSRLIEFESYYGGPFGVATKLELIRSDLSSDSSEYVYSWKKSFLIQRGIISSISLLARIKEKSLRQILTSDIVNSEIEEADLLFENKHYRAAGAVAGVALERHLKTLCEINGITYKIKGIASLAHALYNNKPPKIDNTELSNIEFLGKIRNDCTHPNSPNGPDCIPDDELKRRVRMLIDQTKGYVQKLKCSD